MRLATVTLLMAAIPWSTLAQPQAPAPAAAPNAATTLGRGWAALGAQQPRRALQFAHQLLQTNPRNHDALALAVAALATIPEPIPALDEYERWFTLIRIEDPMLLQSVAVATLEQISTGKDTVLALQSLEYLADAGIAGSRQRLQARRNAQNARAVDAALARLGDRDAVGRLIAGAESAADAGAAGVEMVAAAGTSAIPALQRLLASPAGPTRAAAIRALGKLDARQALDEIRSRLTTDADPLVRAWAAVALARMGDSEGERQVAQMLGSPVHDLRLVAAEAYADRGTGPWLDAIRPLLTDQSGLTRLMAAELVALVDPDAAQAVLAKAADDPNPVVRAEATRILAEAPVVSPDSADWKSLRLRLRDAEAPIRLHAAGAILKLTSPFLR